MRARLALAVAFVALAGCTSTPQATPERDAEAKRFLANPDAAVIYVYRVDIAAQTSDNSVLNVNGRLIGATLPRTFFRFEVQEGANLLHGSGQDQGQLELETRAGELYFVLLQVAGGVSDFRRVDAGTGKRDILRCCSLMENWAPGQRPFLR